MADILNEVVSPEDLKKFEKVYNELLVKNEVTSEAQFEYAWCLVRSKYLTDIKKGIVLLEELYKKNKDGQRDYLYYLALGTARLKEYSTALQYCRAFLSIEPGNQQVLNLEALVKKRMDKDGLLGMAIATGAVLAIGATIGATIACLKK